jgi:hypothetical protein
MLSGHLSGRQHAAAASICEEDVDAAMRRFDLTAKSV